MGRELAKTVDTTEEGGTKESKIGGIVFVATWEVTLGGRGGMKSKWGIHSMSGSNNVVARGKNYWERMSGLAIMAVMRSGLCC